MNKCIFTGRLVRDPETRYTANNVGMTRFTLAVDRDYHKDGEPSADFLNFVAYKEKGEFVQKWFSKGQKMDVVARVRTSNYMDKETGKKVYTTDFVVESVEFGESKKSASANVVDTPIATSEPAFASTGTSKTDDDGFMDIPLDSLGDLPFN